MLHGKPPRVKLILLCFWMMLCPSVIVHFCVQSWILLASRRQSLPLETKRLLGAVDWSLSQRRLSWDYWSRAVVECPFPHQNPRISCLHWWSCIFWLQVIGTNHFSRLNHLHWWQSTWTLPWADINCRPWFSHFNWKVCIWQCSVLTSILIPNSVSFIGKRAFAVDMVWNQPQFQSHSLLFVNTHFAVVGWLR